MEAGSAQQPPSHRTFPSRPQRFPPSTLINAQGNPLPTHFFDIIDSEEEEEMFLDSEEFDGCDDDSADDNSDDPWNPGEEIIIDETDDESHDSDHEEEIKQPKESLIMELTSFLNKGSTFRGSQVFISPKTTAPSPATRLPYTPPIPTATSTSGWDNFEIDSPPQLRVATSIRPPRLLQRRPPPTSLSPADILATVAARERSRRDAQREVREFSRAVNRFQSVTSTATASSSNALPPVRVTLNSIEGRQRSAVDTDRRRAPVQSASRIASRLTSLSAMMPPHYFGPRPRASTSTLQERVLAEMNEGLERSGTNPSREEVLERFGYNSGRDEGTNEEEAEGSWDVTVHILTETEGTNSFEGIMTATSLPEPHPLVTTSFTATILSTSISSTSKSSIYTPKALGVCSRMDDFRYWSEVGPFKTVNKSEMLEYFTRGLPDDPNWLERVTDGWLLMRWKETGFVNLNPLESTLSIAGFYYVALNRATGSIDGAYFDKRSYPYQRITLHPGEISQGFGCR